MIDQSFNTRFRWYEMSGREQMVWAVVYAQTNGDPGAVAHFADQKVSSLRELSIDGEAPNPEHVAARYGPGFEFEEFRSWYPVAMKIAKDGHVEPEEVDEAACREAYDIYRQCATDFY